MIVVRNRQIQDILSNSQEEREIYLESICPDEIVKSQQGGVNHRRKALAYRLSIARGWVPKKRVRPTSNFPLLMKLEQVLRIILRRTSRHSMKIQIRVGPGLLVFNFLMGLQFFVYGVVQKLKRIF
ncbi:MAG: hypothetical protein IPH22_15245 [Nitrosomonas sp.]|nr:hypothetical protein [Nitrosomonas sp.]